jgi:hypothetical protein
MNFIEQSGRLEDGFEAFGDGVERRGGDITT